MAMIKFWNLPFTKLLSVQRLIACKNTSYMHLKIKFSTGCSVICEKLRSRQLIKLSGPDTLLLMQGVITNDTRHLEENTQTSVVLPCIFAMMLNLQGRVLYDTLLYKLNSADSFPSYLLECDTSIVDNVVKHLKMYRLRKKVEIIPVNDIAVWAAFPDPGIFSQNPLSDSDVKEIVNQISFISKLHHNSQDGVVTVTKDPRLQLLGYRLLINTNASIQKLLPNCLEYRGKNNSKYATLRYILGVGEGIQDYPIGNCFPLECNLDYLHGISFHKGCYIGQELTARTYHTGVIRKRLMPITFDVTDDQAKFSLPCVVENEAGKNMGKFLNYDGQHGLALLRVEQCLNTNSLKLKGSNTSLRTFRPHWWPHEVTKGENPSPKD